MNQSQLTLAPSGALSLWQLPAAFTAPVTGRAQTRPIFAAAIRKRRTSYLEGTMYPETHNFIANAAQGSFVNAGQFGSIFAPHPCKTCEAKGHAYDAERPAHPIRSAKEVFSALFARKPQWK